MDIITHALSGVAIGSVFIHSSRKKKRFSACILLVSGLGAVLPDIDVISLWSGFDSTFGQWFNLPLSGKEIYSAKLWYSHHAFFHSLLAAAFFTIVLAGFIALRQKIITRSPHFSMRLLLQRKGILLLSFFLAYVMHLFQDMLTPAASWGGVAFLWPLLDYSGGWGYIWWWNNYDIFLIVCSIITLNLFLWLVPMASQRIRFAIAGGVLLAGILMASKQLAMRDNNYNYSKEKGYQYLEQESLIEQKQVLGEYGYNLMIRIDRSLPVYF